MDNANTKLVTVYTLTDPFEADRIKNTLRDHKIDCKLDGRNQAGFVGALKIGVIVREEDAKFALELIQTHHAHHNEDAIEN